MEFVWRQSRGTHTFVPLNAALVAHTDFNVSVLPTHTYFLSLVVVGEAFAAPPGRAGADLRLDAAHGLQQPTQRRGALPLAGGAQEGAVNIRRDAKGYKPKAISQRI